MTRERMLGVACAAVLCGILVAGLAPFQKPRNAVRWLGDRTGLRFSGYATIFSSGPFSIAAGPEAPACSIEIWLQSASTTAANTIFAFSTEENPLQLTAHQYRASFILKRQVRNGVRRTETIGVDGVFRQVKPVFVSVTSGAQRTSIYVDGRLAESFPRFRFGKDCAGDLEIGTSPTGNERWSGELLGLAIYQSELASVDVLRHFGSWTTQGRPELSAGDAATGVYVFDERGGEIARNAISSGINLEIPERYSLLHQTFLEPFWKEYKPTQSYWNDVVINIAGFIPLGFFFCAYWTTARPTKHAALITVVLGFAVSLTIELIQSHLPTRDSGTTDLFNNTLGTFIGVRLQATKAARDFIVKMIRA